MPDPEQIIRAELEQIGLDPGTEEPIARAIVEALRGAGCLREPLPHGPVLELRSRVDRPE